MGRVRGFATLHLYHVAFDEPSIQLRIDTGHVVFHGLVRGVNVFGAPFFCSPVFPFGVAVVVIIKREQVPSEWRSGSNGRGGSGPCA